MAPFIDTARWIERMRLISEAPTEKSVIIETESTNPINKDYMRTTDVIGSFFAFDFYKIIFPVHERVSSSRTFSKTEKVRYDFHANQYNNPHGRF